jgi:tRNA(Met) C34 N-acetyltransferase TmcA
VGTPARHRQRARVPQVRLITQTRETKQTRCSREAGSIRYIVGADETNRENAPSLVVDSKAGIPVTVESRQEPR